MAAVRLCCQGASGIRAYMSLFPTRLEVISDRMNDDEMGIQVAGR